jgi:hypothetical protein
LSVFPASTPEEKNQQWLYRHHDKLRELMSHADYMKLLREHLEASDPFLQMEECHAIWEAKKASEPHVLTIAEIDQILKDNPPPLPPR